MQFSLLRFSLLHLTFSVSFSSIGSQIKKLLYKYICLNSTDNSLFYTLRGKISKTSFFSTCLKRGKLQPKFKYVAPTVRLLVDKLVSANTFFMDRFSS